MAKRKLNQLFRDVKEQVNLEALMKHRRGIDIGGPVYPDTRLSSFVGAAAISAPTVSLVASDHVVRVAKPNRKESTSKMRHHRVDR